MTTPAHSPTLVDLAALDEASSKGPWSVQEVVTYDENDDEVVGDEAAALLIVQDMHYDGEADWPRVKDCRFAAAAKGFAPRLLADLRALCVRWDDYRVPTKPDDPQAVRAFDSGIQSGLSTAASELRALIGEAAR